MKHEHPDIVKERELFESAMKDLGASKATTDVFERNESGEYLDMFIRPAWVGWMTRRRYAPSFNSDDIARAVKVGRLFEQEKALRGLLGVMAADPEANNTELRASLAAELAEIEATLAEIVPEHMREGGKSDAGV